MIYNNVLEMIGNTPIVKINRMAPEGVGIYAKLEKYNPMGSVKERTVKYLIETAERSGRLTHDKVILEATSGNTGIGLALLAQQKGYKLHLVMPESVSEERKRILAAFGATLIFTPASEGMDGAIKRVWELNDHPTYFIPAQYDNPANPQAHYDTTAEEIWADVPQLTHFVAGIGTSGTIMGVSQKLKRYNPDVKVIGVEPESNGIQGLKNMREQMNPAIYNPRRIDETVFMGKEEAFEVARRLAREEGLFMGMSSGAAMAGALHVAEELDSGTIVVLFPDGGEKYLSTELFKQEEF